MNTRLKTEQSFPMIAKVLGYAGVIPFAVLSVCIAADVDLGAFGVVDAPGKLLAYGAVIISFIGAVHFGVAMQPISERQNLLYIYSVIPALIAWCWFFFNVKNALFGMGLTIAVMLIVDRWLLSGLVPAGYLKMRLHLTIVVAACLILAAIRVP